jgi:HAD superfamily hydrolase (TIGR01509 family)
MIKAVIFDLWETLATKNVGISKSLQQRFGIPKDDNFLVAYERAVQLTKWESEEAMARNFLAEFRLVDNQESIDFIVDLFGQGIQNATLFAGVKDLFLSLKQADLKLGMLSNTTVFESVVLKNLGLESVFDAVVFSWHKGNLKPSPASFEDILSQLGVAKDEVIFIDDTEKNIFAAEKCGIRSIRFESVERLKSELERLIRLG